MNFKRNICILNQEDLISAGCFDVAASISVCENALLEYSKGNIIFPDKVSVVFNEETQDRINCLPAGIITDKVYGMKWVSVFPNNPMERNVPNLSAVILLSEMESGFPVAFMEGTLCSNLRTAAMSAIAAKNLAVKEPKTIGFIGSGEQAKSHFLAMKSVFPSIDTCRISANRADSEELFIKQMEGFHSDVEFIACHEEYKKAVEDADIIVTAISGQEPILKAAWINNGAFYCHVGGYEDEFAVAEKADKIVCDAWDVVKHRTQTISRMYKQGILKDSDIYADLHEIVSGSKTGRSDDNEFIYYNGVGLSYIDIALANWMYKKAVGAGLGKSITMQEKSMFDFQI